MIEFVLTELLAGSLRGSAVTGMTVCVSQAPRNGAESYQSLTYGSNMAGLLNVPKRQPCASLRKLVATAQKNHKKSAAIVSRGVHGKYQKRRAAEATQWAQTVRVLEALAGGGS